jgi:hypothetical protein
MINKDNVNINIIVITIFLKFKGYLNNTSIYKQKKQSKYWTNEGKKY